MKDRIGKFLETKKEDLNSLAEQYPEKKSFFIDWQELEKYDSEVAEELIRNPDDIIDLCEQALNEKGIPVLEIDKEKPGEPEFHVRFYNLPREKDYNLMVRDINSDYITRLISTEGLVNRISDVLPKLYSARFRCISCGEFHEVKQERSDRLRGFIRQPVKCSCGKPNFRFLPEESDWIDFQILEIQEPLELIKGGEQARRMKIWVEDDMTDQVTAGDKVIVTGVVRLKPPLKKGSVYHKFIEVNNIEGVEREFEDIEISKKEEREIKKLAKDPKINEKIIDSIAPSIYGYNEVKEAIALQLFGGRFGKTLPDGTAVRADMHLLLIGDPGVAKSRILQYVDQIAPKSIYVTGKGTTGAGLTAAAEKDELAEGAWTLKAGALVLAGGGVACLHPDTNVLMNNEIIPIKKIFQEERALKAKTNSEIIDIHDLMVKTQALKPSTMQTISKDAVRIRRKTYSGEMYELSLKSGFMTRLTPDHLLMDGNTLKWKRCDEFEIGDSVVAPLKLESSNDDTYILDIVPSDWFVYLDEYRDEFLGLITGNKAETEKVGNRVRVGEFREILREADVYDEWKTRIFTFSKKYRKYKLKKSKITPKLTYLIGFIRGDGDITVDKRRTRIGISQSIVNQKQITRVKSYWKEVFGYELNIHKRVSQSVIREKTVKSENLILYTGNRLFTEIYNYVVGNHLRRILKLPDENLNAFIAGLMDSDGCISIKRGRKKDKLYSTVHIEFLFSNHKEENLNFILALRRFDAYAKYVHKKNIGIVRITGRKDVKNIIHGIQAYSVKARNFPMRINKVSSTSDKLPVTLVSSLAEDILNRINKSILVEKGIWSTLYAYRKKRTEPSRDQLLKIKERLLGHLPKDVLPKINLLLSRDFFIEKIEKIDVWDHRGYVYDLYVPDLNNFIAEGIFVHNCIDEFDKMDKEDRGAMHEAMEQQTISLAKAGIVAKFRANTAILAAANPKFSRFDNYKPLGEQFDIPPTLLSRFDLIFPIRDILDKETDKRIAEHMLKMHKTGEEVKDLEPVISSDLFKKYVAYARRNIHPLLTDDAAEKIRDFYVELRSGSKETVRATPRQLEALVRLAEASAKIRFSDTVTVSDAERAISLTNFVLREIAYDKSTGEIDIDRIMTTHPKSTRDKIRVIEDIIRELIGNSEGNMASLEDIKTEASMKNIQRFDAEKIIMELKTKGIIYEPRHGRFMFTEDI